MSGTMSDDPTIEGDGKLIAAEYVLGVLSTAERRAVQARIALDPALRAEVEYWEQRLGPLASELKPVDPPPRVWAKIEETLAADLSHRSLWQSLPFWRWAAIGSAAVATASLAAFLFFARIPPSNPPLVAKLETQLRRGLSGGGADFVVAVDSGGGGLTVVPAFSTDVDQRALELWLIAPGEQPRSLGLIEPGRPVHVSVPADLMPRVTPQATLAVSLEPLGGSPTGLPTGPVIASGKLTKL
jgi:anti-sigma-K factor RskA